MTEDELAKKLESENITLSPLTKRFFAHIIDDVVIAFFAFFAFSDMFEAVAGQDISVSLSLTQTLMPYIIVMKVVYQAFFVWMYGATVGKMAMKIRIISLADGQKPNMLFSFTRSNMRIISETVLFLGFLWALKDTKKQTWEDIAARTLVVNA
ncbi:MAG: RDD family protein [Campylobacteraceae bacterium]|jgi:uncharacterized RDD family membrane protein YckC|nr:RDD family protein [Campylobacteraceae bacterium]